MVDVTFSASWDFKDPAAPNEDQNHHFAGYFWLGFKYSSGGEPSYDVLQVALDATGDWPRSKNPGDYRLGVMAAYFGAYWKENLGYQGGKLTSLLQNSFETAENYFNMPKDTLP